MPGEITAIETEYLGYKFRSRLEARWAVFFTEAHIPFEYEPEGYEIGMERHAEGCRIYNRERGQFLDEDYECMCDGGRTKYLPDFWLPETETWVEVKGSWKAFNLQTLMDAVDWGCGLPKTSYSLGTTRGLLLLGSIPNVRRKTPAHLILQHDSGGYINATSFMLSRGVAATTNSRSMGYFDSLTEYDSDLKDRLESYWSNYYTWFSLIDSRIKVAYQAARMARFEYGQRGYA